MSNNGQNFDSSSAMEKMFDQGFRKLAEADRMAEKNGGDEKTVKLLGVIEVPEIAATVIEGLWNEGSDSFTKWLQPRSLDTFKKWGEKAGLKDTALNRSATLGVVALNTALKSGMFINPVFEAFKNQYDEKKALARKLAPILDVDGNHSVGSLMHSNNDMIRAHCQRLQMRSSTQIKNNVMKLLVNVVPSTVLDLPDYKHMWRQGTHLDRSLTTGEQRTKDFMGRFARVGAAPLANVFTHSNDRKLRNTFSSPHSALELVLELSAQVSEKPDAGSFSLPGRGARSLPLEAYIKEIIVQHQRDMADISPDETEIRDALKDDLAAAAKTLAAAVKAGDLSALSLVQLIGGGDVVKHHGRVIADADTIQERIDALGSGKGKVMTPVDTREYLQESNFTVAQLKDDLGVLKGEERLHYAAMFPNELLKEAGMHDKDIQDMRAATMGDLAHHICAMYVALDARSDEELKADGLAGHEIKSVRQMARSIHEKGDEAAAKLKSNLGHEHTVPNWLVTHAKDFGTVLQDGLQRLEDAPKREKPEAEKRSWTKPEDYLHGHETSHRQREDHRRSAHGEHEHSY